jgi:hypothetical protein
MVTTHCDYDGRIKNDGYMNADRTNYLKWEQHEFIRKSNIRWRSDA